MPTAVCTRYALCAQDGTEGIKRGGAKRGFGDEETGVIEIYWWGSPGRDC